MDKRLFSVEEAAEYLGLAKGHVYNLVWQRRIQCVKLGRRVLLDKAVLDNLIADNTRHPTLIDGKPLL